MRFQWEGRPLVLFGRCSGAPVQRLARGCLLLVIAPDDRPPGLTAVHGGTAYLAGAPSSPMIVLTVCFFLLSRNQGAGRRGRDQGVLPHLGQVHVHLQRQRRPGEQARVPHARFRDEQLPLGQRAQRAIQGLLLREPR